VLVNATFWSKGGRLEDLAPADFDRAAQVNLSGGFALAREAAEAMTTGGSIVWFASMYGLVSPDPSLYEPRRQQLYAWAAQGHLKPHIGHRFPLAEFRAAMETVSGRRALGRVVITMDE